MSQLPDKLDLQLAYIAASPPREHGGFHPQVVETAKAAIAELASLRERVRELEKPKSGSCHFCDKQTDRKEYAGAGQDIYVCDGCHATYVPKQEQP